MQHFSSLIKYLIYVFCFRLKIAKEMGEVRNEDK